MRFIILSLVLLCSGCSITKNISDQPPYNQCIGKKFVLKEDMYIFQDHGISQCSIAGQHNGIMGLPRYVDKKYLEDDYFGKHNYYLTILGIIPKGSIFTIIKVIDELTFDDSFTRILIAFDDIPSIRNGIITTSILNWKNYPFDKTFGDPPIFEARYALPLPSDGIWWK